MMPKEKTLMLHRELKEYGEWFLAELKKSGVSLSVVSGNGLHIKGEITPAQKEYIRIWKRQLIEAVSPKCPNCKQAMQIIEDGKLWLCPFGCESQKAK